MKNLVASVINTSRNGVSSGRPLIFPVLFFRGAPLITYPVDGGPGSCPSIGRLSGREGSLHARRPRPLFDQRLGGELMFSGAASFALCGPRVKMCQNSSSRSRRRPQKAVRRPYKLTARPGPASARWWKGIVEKSCDATRLTDTLLPPLCLTNFDRN